MSGKIIASVFATLGLLFGIFISFLFRYTIHIPFYYYTICILFILLIYLYLLLEIWEWPKRKTRNKGLGILSLILGLFFFGKMSLDVYHQSITIEADTPIDLLSEYEPFKKNTKTATLSEESSLKFMDNLLHIAGAAELYPIYSAFARAVYPKADYSWGPPPGAPDYVTFHGTKDAFYGLIHGSLDIIFVFKPSGDDLERIPGREGELHYTSIGKEAFVFYVNSKNPVNNLTVADIQEIYSGKITNWEIFGGKRQSIQAYQRDENHKSQKMMESLMGGVSFMEPPMDYETMGPLTFAYPTDYRNYKNAIGYSYLFDVAGLIPKNKIKLLALNGIEPTEKNIRNDIYPYTFEFYAVTAGSNNPNVGKFITWILSEQGQELIKKSGYTPVR